MMRGTGRGILIGIVLVVVLFLGYNYLTNKPSGALNGLKDCGDGVYVNQYATCPNTTSQTNNGTTNNSPASNTTNNSSMPANAPVTDTGGPGLATTGNACPSQDFSLKKGTTCNFPGGRLLICEGDLNDSLGVHHDNLGTTGQVDEIDRAATIDGTDNGGSCHYSPPGTLQASISSVKDGCGCSNIQVFKDGQQVQ